ncbi:MAG: hypothetical protein M1812_002134 [Candelaria pacifica]|nr:MAG: hypothetical protein M1812_002134 [Candelaria pacifica]
MHSYVQFITTPTADTPGTTLLLHFDNKRYYIGNVAEGTQRAGIQRGVRLSKLSDVFITGRTEWANIGGLMSMILTLADRTSSSEISRMHHRAAKKGSTIGGREGNDGASTVEVDSSGTKHTLTIHGGLNLTHTLATARRFVFRHGMPVVVHEYGSETENGNGLAATWSDNNINVWAMPIPPEGARDIQGQTSGDLNLEAAVDSPITSSSNDKNACDKQIREAVVSDMFNSGWRLDALVEVPLSQVRLPGAIFIRNSETGHIDKYEGPLPGSAAPVPDITVLMRQPWPGALIESLPPTSPSKEAVSYIIRNHPQRGRFDPVKAKQLKVEPGRKYAELTMGKSVEALDGSIVTPDMVLSKSKDGGGFAVVELPSVEYVKGLLRRQEWKSEEVMKGVGAIIWILGDGVSQDHDLRTFVNATGHLKHILSSRDHAPNYLALDSAASAAIQLHLIYPTCFPIPDHDNVTLPQHQAKTSPATAKPPISFVTAQRGQIVQLEPAVELLDHAIVPPLNTAKTVQGTPEKVLRLARDAEAGLSSVGYVEKLRKRQRGLLGNDVEIITLGTGSASPSKYRNVSATLIRVPGAGSYLLDCGENTLGQLKRVFPHSQFKEVLRDLKMIWISHLHADHHLGTVSVIKAWYNEVHQNGTPTISDSSMPANIPNILRHGQKLSVISAAEMINWLVEYSSVEDFGYDKLLPLTIGTAKPREGLGSKLTWGNLPVGFKTEDQALNAAMTAATGLADIQAVDVDHCVGAKAVSLTFPTGFKLSYSGDCRPSKGFAKIGKGSTVLLHEATFDDELHGDALAKKHSTTSEALGVGIAMGARRIVLTHFSQRYQKIPVINDAGGDEPDSEDEEDPNIPDVGEANEASTASLETTRVAVRDDVMGDEVDLVRRVSTRGSSETPDRRANSSSPIDPQQKGERAVVNLENPAKTDLAVAVAFDYMRVRVGEIANLQRFTPALLELFKENATDDKSINDGTQGVKNTPDAKRTKKNQHDRTNGSPEGKKSKTSRRHSGSVGSDLALQNS